MAYNYRNEPEPGTNSFTNPYDGQVYYQSGGTSDGNPIQWATRDGTPLSRPDGSPLPVLEQNAIAREMMATAFQSQQQAGGAGMTGQQLANMTANTMSSNEINRTRDEQELTSLQGDYDAIPDRLRSLYSNAAKKAGTASDTTEFKAGLESETQQGTRGAQAALGGRLTALYQRLGRPLPEGMGGQAWDPSAAQATNSVDNTVDNSTTASTEGGAAPAPEPDAPEAPATTQNAVAKVASPTTASTVEAKRKAYSSYQS